jgi:hypothetical protein
MSKEPHIVLWDETNLPSRSKGTSGDRSLKKNIGQIPPDNITGARPEPRPGVVMVRLRTSPIRSRPV